MCSSDLALPFYSIGDFDKFDKFAVLFKLDSIILRKYFIQLSSRSFIQSDLS